MANLAEKEERIVPEKKRHVCANGKTCLCLMRKQIRKLKRDNVRLEQTLIRKLNGGT